MQPSTSRPASRRRAGRRRLASCCLFAVGLFSTAAGAQDAARGAALYLRLPGEVASCVECHGPDPAANRNRLLNGADGPQAIATAIVRAAPMGYLGDVLSETDRADLSAYLARVRRLVTEPVGVAVWPRSVEFGRLAPGAAVGAQRVWLRNVGEAAVSLDPPAVDAAALSLTHDCPAVLAAGAQCRVELRVATDSAQRVLGALRWSSSSGADWSPQWVGVAARVEGPTAAGVLVADLPAGTVSLQAPAGGLLQREFDLVNAGTAALSLGVAALTGPGAADFSLTGSQCAAALQLQPAGRCRVRLSYAPRSAGRAQAALQWRSEGTALSVIEVLGESGAAPPPPPPPSPPPAPAPAPGPAPAPTPALASTGSGGCRMALAPGRIDPTLIFALALAALALVRRRAAAAADALPSN